MKLSKNRTQKEIALKNHLQVLLISDPNINKSSCAMDVAVGHLEDPEEHLGLAHFLEHMLFLGTQKYPKVDEYNSYLHSHKGYSNAYTASENTNYYFEIDHSAFEGALDRFSQFFIAPLFNKEFVERELNAVHSEHQKNLGDDDWRLRMILKNHFRKDHPARKFSTGDATTLGQVTREELIKFYEKNYSANQMKLVLMSSASLPDLEKWALDYFSQVPNHSRPKHSYTSQVFSSESLPQKVEVKSVADLKKIELVFETPCSTDYVSTKPENIISHLTGHEGPGSILSRLKKENLATELVSWHENYSFAGFFHFTIDLTEQGFSQIPKVLGIFFSYVQILKQSKLPSYVIEEKKHMAQVNFQYKEPREGGGFTSYLASKMHHYPATQIEQYVALIPERNEDHEALFLSCIEPEKMTLFIQAKDMTTDQIEPYYKAHYKTSTIEASLLKELNKNSYLGDLSQPEENSFLPKDFSIEQPEKSKEPRKILDTSWGVFYHQDDHVFHLPKAELSITHVTTKTTETSQNKTKALLYIMCLNEMLNEWGYNVTLGGLEFDISLVKKGIRLTVSGYTEHIPRLMEHLAHKLKNIEVSPSLFETLKTNLKQDIQNAYYGHAYSQTLYEIKYLNSLNVNHRKDIYFEDQDGNIVTDLIEEVTLEEVKDFSKFIYEDLEVEGCSYGPLNTKVLSETLQNYPKTLGVEATKNRKAKKDLCVQLKEGSSWRRSVATLDQNHCWAQYIQFGKRDFHLNAAVRVGMCLLEPGFYEEMRTRQQLGYIASSSLYFTDTMLGILLLVQSSQYTPDEIAKRAEKFLSDFQVKLAALPTESWQTFKASVAKELREKEETIYEKHQCLHSEALVFDELYGYKEKVAQACEALNPEDVLKVYQKALTPPQKKSVEVFMYKGSAPKKENSKDLITDVTKYKKQHQWA